MPTNSIQLTARDHALLRLIAQRRGVPLDLLADELFLIDPLTGKRNRNPLRACERRIRALARADYVMFVREYDGTRRRQVIVPANGTNGIGCGRASRRQVPRRTGVHHLKTQDAVSRLRRVIERRGGRVLRVQLDGELRARERRGHGRIRAAPSRSIPDAVLNIEMPDFAGEVAVEFVTSKDTDRDITTKKTGFQRFGFTFWVADNERTAARVRALTGETCSVLK